MDIIERIQEIIDTEGMTISSFAKRLGVGDQTIRGIVAQRRNKPGFDLTAKILQTFAWVSAEWLILGIGDMKKDENENNPSTSMKELIDYLKEKYIKIEKLIEEKAELKVLYEIEKKKKQIS